MIYAFENLCFCQSLKKKSEMWRYKFENLLIAFSMNRYRHLFSIVDGKSKMGRYKFENLLIAFLISRQRKKCHLKISQSVLFTKKIGQSVLFLFNNM